MDVSEQYEGGYVDGLREGRGKLTWREREGMYTIYGFWTAGELDGLATHTCSSKTQDVIYRMGEIVWSINIAKEDEHPDRNEEAPNGPTKELYR